MDNSCNNKVLRNRDLIRNKGVISENNKIVVLTALVIRHLHRSVFLLTAINASLSNNLDWL